MILLGGFVWAWVAFGQNALMKFLKRYGEAEISSFPEIKEPTLRPFEVWGKVSKIPLGFSEMTKYEWVLMLSKLRFCLMWYLYLLKVCTIAVFYCFIHKKLFTSPFSAANEHKIFNVHISLAKDPLRAFQNY